MCLKVRERGKNRWEKGVNLGKEINKTVERNLKRRKILEKLNFFY